MRNRKRFCYLNGDYRAERDVFKNGLGPLDPRGAVKVKKNNPCMCVCPPLGPPITKIPRRPPPGSRPDSEDGPVLSVPELCVEPKIDAMFTGSGHDTYIFRGESCASVFVYE